MASSIRSYLLSFPERVVRSALGLGAGVAREIGAVALPAGVRGSQLYQNLVDATLRYLTEKVGGVETAAGAEIPDDFVARLADLGVRTGTIDPRTVRLVTHKDVDDDDIAAVIKAFDRLAAA